jgi:hypothetical protein
MHARAPQPPATVDFGNTLRNKDIQDHICEGALAKAARTRDRQTAHATTPQNWQLVGERPSGQTTPCPNEGFPMHQAVDVVSLYRGTVRQSTERNFTEAHAADPEGSVLIIPFRAGNRTNPAESQDICENAITAAFKLSDEDRNRIDSLTPDMTPNYNNQQRSPVMPIMFTGLRPEVATALCSQRIWAVEGYGAFAAMEFPPRQLLETLGTLGNLTGKPNDRDARKVVEALIRRLSHHERFLNYVAMGAQEQSPAIPVVEHAINILASIRADHTEILMNRQKCTCWKISIASPIADPNQWEAFREAARAPEIPTSGLGLGSWLRQSVCLYCIGQDHAETTCLFKHVPGWYDTDDIARARMPDSTNDDGNDQQGERNGNGNRAARRGRGQGPSQGRGNRGRGRGRDRRNNQLDYY